MRKETDTIKQILFQIGAEKVPADVISLTSAVANDFIASIEGTPKTLGLDRITASKYVRFAAAAVIVFALIAGLNYLLPHFQASNVAWGQVVEELQEIDSYQLEGSSVLTDASQDPPVEERVNFKSYYSYDISRTDVFVGGALISLSYYLPAENQIITVMPHSKKYMSMSMSDEHVESRTLMTGDPRQYIGQFLSKPCEELGALIINGVRAEGVRSASDETGTSELWVDPQTNLPIRLEMDSITSGGQITSHMIIENFHWNVDFEPGFFEPNIPDDYNFVAQSQIPPSTNEEQAISGLQLFAELTGGRYPRSLDELTVRREFMKALNQKEAALRDANEPTIPESIQVDDSMNMLAAAVFYEELIKREQDVKYYGDVVTASDTGAILLRWRISETHYRVLYGDLTTEDLTYEQLQQLEEQLAE